jgi:hypothetical protein
MGFAIIIKQINGMKLNIIHDDIGVVRLAKEYNGAEDMDG